MSKVDEFSEALQKKASIAKGFSHPARLAILEFLAKQSTCIPVDLCEELPLSRGTVKQHLDELKSRGWIKSTLLNDKVVMCLDNEKINEDLALLSEFVIQELKEKSCC